MISTINIFLVFCTFSFVANEPIHDEQQYVEDFLSHYGYLEKGLLGPDRNRNEIYIRDAISDFQHFLGINVTGSMDDETKRLMKIPRCGVKDKITPEEVNQYVLGKGQWESSRLTYAIRNYPSWLNLDEVVDEIASAFNIWAKYTNLIFVRKSSSKIVNITITFASYEHGDAKPFDGAGKVLGHAFFPDGPRRGQIHLDLSEKWTVNSVFGKSVYQIVAHEIGHVLGIKHSMYKSSIMTPYHDYNPAFRRNLSKDDIRTIQELYGPKKGKKGLKKKKKNDPKRRTG